MNQCAQVYSHGEQSRAFKDSQVQRSLHGRFRFCSTIWLDRMSNKLIFATSNNHQMSESESGSDQQSQPTTVDDQVGISTANLVLCSNLYCSPWDAMGDIFSYGRLEQRWGWNNQHCNKWGENASHTLKRLLDQAEDAAKSEDEEEMEVTTSNVGLFIIIGLLVLCLVLCIIFCAVRSLLLTSNSHSLLSTYCWWLIMMIKIAGGERRRQK